MEQNMKLSSIIKSLDTKIILKMYNLATKSSTSRFSTRANGEERLLKALEGRPAKEIADLFVACGQPKPVVDVKSATLSPGEVFKGDSRPAVDHSRSNKIISDTLAVEGGSTIHSRSAEKPAPKTRQKRLTNLPFVPGRPVACREGSKQAAMVDLMSRPNGASMSELMEALAGGKKPWTEISVRAGFGWDLKQKGYGVKSIMQDGTERFFLVVPTGFAIPAHRPVKKLQEAEFHKRQKSLEV
jgi:hypothetical protein